MLMGGVNPLTFKSNTLTLRLVFHLLGLHLTQAEIESQMMAHKEEKEQIRTMLSAHINQDLDPVVLFRVAVAKGPLVLRAAPFFSLGEGFEIYKAPHLRIRVRVWGVGGQQAHQKLTESSPKTYQKKPTKSQSKAHQKNTKRSPKAHQTLTKSQP